MSTLNPNAPAFVPAVIAEPTLFAEPTPFEIAMKPLENPNRAVLIYPLSYIGDEDLDYDSKEFCKGLLDEEPFDIGNFPKNITEYYWIHDGENDEESWHLFCKIALPTSEDAYAFYTAWCDYTGFDCQGGMRMTVSKSAKALFNSLSTPIRDLFIKEKILGKQEKKKNGWEEYLESWPKAPPPEKSGKNAVNPKNAFIRIWHNDEELKLTLGSVNGLEMEELDYAIRGLTAQFLTPKGAPKGTATKLVARPQKKFYNVSVFSSQVSDIDSVFIKRFNNPDKKWLLRMPPHKGDSFIRKWGKVEVSFTLY